MHNLERIVTDERTLAIPINLDLLQAGFFTHRPKRE
jgi:hypothetical protein